MRALHELNHGCRDPVGPECNGESPRLLGAWEQPRRIPSGCHPVRSTEADHHGTSGSETQVHPQSNGRGRGEEKGGIEAGRPRQGTSCGKEDWQWPMSSHACTHPIPHTRAHLQQAPWTAFSTDLALDKPPPPPEVSRLAGTPHPPKALQFCPIPERTPGPGYPGIPRMTGSAPAQEWLAGLAPSHAPPSRRTLHARARSHPETAVQGRGLKSRGSGAHPAGLNHRPPDRVTSGDGDRVGDFEVSRAMQELLLRLLATPGVDAPPVSSPSSSPPATRQHSASSAVADAVASPPHAVQSLAGACLGSPRSTGTIRLEAVDRKAGCVAGRAHACWEGDAQTLAFLKSMAGRLSAMEHGYQQMQLVVQVLLSADLKLDREVGALRSQLKEPHIAMVRPWGGEAACRHEQRTSGPAGPAGELVRPMFARALHQGFFSMRGRALTGL